MSVCTCVHTVCVCLTVGGERVCGCESVCGGMGTCMCVCVCVCESVRGHGYVCVCV